MSLSQKDIQTVKTALQQPNAVQHDGGFYVVYKYGRWHLLTTGYTAGPNAQQFIQTIKFMNDAELDRYLGNFIEVPKVETFAEMFEGFTHEVEAKLLNEPDAYETMIANGMLQAMTGTTTDTMQVSNIGARDEQLMKALRTMMKGGEGVPSVLFHFSRPADER